MPMASFLPAIFESAFLVGGSSGDTTAEWRLQAEFRPPTFLKCGKKVRPRI